MLTFKTTGGKAKPLKAAKKQVKEMDSDDERKLEKRQKGRSLPVTDANYMTPTRAAADHHAVSQRRRHARSWLPRLVARADR